MATSVLQDYLQDYSFWLFDIANVAPGEAPMLNPLFGFSSISAPEMTLETDEIGQADWYFKKPIIKKASVSPITLSRGVLTYDNDFWVWITQCLKGDASISPFIKVPALDVQSINFQGNPFVNLPETNGLTFDYTTPILPTAPIRRDLMLIQFFPRFPIRSNPLANTTGGREFGRLAGEVSAGLNAANNAIPGAFRLRQGDRIRAPARGFLLKGAIATRYKAASDFDAQSGAVSIQEIDLSYEYFEQISFQLNVNNLA